MSNILTTIYTPQLKAIIEATDATRGLCPGTRVAEVSEAVNASGMVFIKQETLNRLAKAVEINNTTQQQTRN